MKKITSIEHLASVCQGVSELAIAEAIREYICNIQTDIHEESEIYARAGKSMRVITDYVFDKWLGEATKPLPSPYQAP